MLCYKVLALSIRLYIVVRKWTWINCKYILQTLGQPLKCFLSINVMLRVKRKWNHLKYSVKTREGRKRQWQWEK